MTENERRTKACAQARAWIGKNEADGSHREIIDIYNRGRGTAPPISYSDPWCAGFVSAVGIAAGLPEILPGINCDAMIAAYKARGQWIENDAYTPKPGDLIFYDWQDSGVGDNTGSSDHVGIVTGVNGKLLTVIEGNYSDSVKQRYIYVDGKFIRGYAVPDYAGAADAPGNAAILDKPEGAVTAEMMAEEPAAVSTADTGSVRLPILRRGDAGEAVRAAQLLLIGRGCPCGRWGADGDFGPDTRAAVLLFQQKRGLARDGEIGPDTWTELLTK